MNEGEVGLIQLSLFYGILILPLALLWWLGLRQLVRGLIVGVARMTLQLGLIGIYLKFLFDQDSLWLNVFWLLVMVTVANLHILTRAGISKKHLFWVSQFSLLVGVGIVLFGMILVVQPEPWYQTRYLIPLAGMLLGNCLTGNILVLDRFYSAVSERYEQFMGDLLLGAGVYEALQPFVRNALQAALSPIVATLTTLGVVALPGMMTGQILGGAEPVEAVIYQIMIMLGIASSMVVCAVLNIMLSIRLAFDGYGLLNRSIMLSPER
ncbi:ABC transporter permease [Endozoicomonas sp.]|uniref:ABC transporter permease n=1 Tax=Endozoicomonas sp. TaxID=1892382 RepID=UPI003AF6739E